MRDFFANIKKGKSFLSALIILAIIANFIPQGNMRVYADME